MLLFLPRAFLSSHHLQRSLLGPPSLSFKRWEPDHRCAQQPPRLAAEPPAASASVPIALPLGHLGQHSRGRPACSIPQPNCPAPVPASLRASGHATRPAWQAPHWMCLALCPCHLLRGPVPVSPRPAPQKRELCFVHCCTAGSMSGPDKKRAESRITQEQADSATPPATVNSPPGCRPRPCRPRSRAPTALVLRVPREGPEGDRRSGRTHRGGGRAQEGRRSRSGPRPGTSEDSPVWDHHEGARELLCVRGTLRGLEYVVSPVNIVQPCIPLA